VLSHASAVIPEGEIDQLTLFRFAWQSCQIELAVSHGCLFGTGGIRAIGLKGNSAW
jgi:hypothetical protein